MAWLRTQSVSRHSTLQYNHSNFESLVSAGDPKYHELLTLADAIHTSEENLSSSSPPPPAVEVDKTTQSYNPADPAATLVQISKDDSSVYRALCAERTAAGKFAEWKSSIIDSAINLAAQMATRRVLDASSRKAVRDVYQVIQPWVSAMFWPLQHAMNRDLPGPSTLCSEWPQYCWYDYWVAHKCPRHYIQPNVLWA